MRAVNLIPAEERRGATAAGRSGGAVYALLGALALLVILAGAYATIGRSIDNKRAEIARVKAEADAAEAKSADLKAYTDFAGLRKQRTDTITQLAGSRFDWARVLHEVARTIPDDAWLSDLHGTAPATSGTTPAATPSSTPSSSSSSSTSTPSAGAATATGPTIEINGCTSGQAAVARLMVELRRIDGVDKVNLTSSTKAGAAGGSTSSAPAPAPTTGSGSGAAACTGSQFAMTLQFRAPGAAASTGAAAPATTATPAGSAQ